MHGREKSDSAIVAMKPANKAGQPAAEQAERRVEAEGNMAESRTRRTPSRESVLQGLDRVRQAAKAKKKERFTALLHHVSVDLLKEAYSWLKRDAAPGVDGVSRGRSMSRTGKPTLWTCMPAFIGARIERYPRGGSTS